MTQADTAIPSFTTHRILKAPRDLVWRAWTDPAILERWMGPDPAASILLEHDLRPGGVWAGKILMPDGAPPMFSHFVFTIVEPVERLAWRHSFGDGQGGLARHPMAPDFPLVMLSEVRLSDAEVGTRMDFSFTPVEASDSEIAAFRAAMDGFEQGWGSTFDALDGFVAGAQLTGRMLTCAVGDSAVRINRYFDAPPQRVFDAHIKPELISKWMLGPHDHTMPVCEVDARPGGKARYVWEGPDNFRMTLLMEFVDVAPPQRIVHLERFDEPWAPEGWARVTSLFLACGKGTAHEMIIDFGSRGARDGAVGSGMFGGMEAGNERLDAMLRPGRA